MSQHKPHLFGISECELTKVANFDENQMKISGYNLLFPKSWTAYGYARVVMYVKSSLQYERLAELEDDCIQSIWIKGGFRNSKQLLFCHAYREHTNSLGNSIQNQRKSLEKFLLQWEKASCLKNNHEPNEIHICGDMNLDSLIGRGCMSSWKFLSAGSLSHKISI